MEAELNIKGLVIEKNNFQIEELKIQMKKLIKMTEYPRLCELLHRKFNENGQTGAGETQRASSMSN